MTSSVAVSEAATWVKSMYKSQSRDLKSENKDKIWKSKEFLHKSPTNRWFRNGVHSLLKPADVRGSADIIYSMRRILLLCRSLLTVIDVKK